MGGSATSQRKVRRIVRGHGSTALSPRPDGIAFDNPNTDEYAPEAETILPRLSGCCSSDDVLPVVHEEFGRWFGTDTAGPREHYTEIASELWQLWQGHLHKPNAS